MQHSDSGSSSPLISVILPVYNHGHLLAEAIDSVLAQRYGILELIVVNDGSTDCSAEVLAAYSKEARLRVHHQENRGIAAALNQGFSLARGSFFTWTSADNRYEADALQQMLSYLLRNPDIELVYADVRLIDEDGSPLRASEYRRLDQDAEDRSILRLPRAADSLLGFSDNFINACFLYRRSLAQRVGTYRSDLLGIEDYDFWLRAGLCARIAHIETQTPLYNYRLHEHTLTAQLKSEALQGRQQQLLERSEGFCSDNASFFPPQPKTIRGLRRESQKLLFEEPGCMPIRLKVKEAAQAASCGFSLADWSGFLELSVESDLAGEPWLTFAPLRPPPALFRARDSNFAAITKAAGTTASLLLPLADTLEPEVEQCYREILAATDLTLAFFCRSAAARQNADALYLASGASDKVRIIDAQEQSQSMVSPQGQLASLLYALSSADAVYLALGQALCPLHLWAVYAATAGKPLFCSDTLSRTEAETRFLEEYFATASLLHRVTRCSALRADTLRAARAEVKERDCDHWLKAQTPERFAARCRGMSHAHFPLKL